jgi:hypothetical protein
VVLPNDAFGQRLGISGRHLAVVDPIEALDGSSFGVVSIFERDPHADGAWMLADKLAIRGSNPDLMSAVDVCIEDDLLVLGTPFDNTFGVDAGAAYIFEKQGEAADSWELTAKLVPHDPDPSSLFGLAVARSGDFIVVGAPYARQGGFDMGAAYVFQRSPIPAREWIEVQKLSPTELGISSQFGVQIAMEGDRLVIGASNQDTAQFNTGAVFVFRRAGDSWTQESVLAPPGLSVSDSFGSGLSLEGETLAVGAPGDDSAGQEIGSVYVFEWKTDEWTLAQHLLPMGLSEFSESGINIAIDGDTIYSGAFFEGTGGFATGAVLEYRRDPSSQTWFQVAVLRASDAAPNDFFGYVDASHGTLAVGALKALKPGAVYLFDARDLRTVTTFCTGTPGVVRDCVPGLETLGVPTASHESDFRIWSRTVPAQNFGLFLYSTTANAMPDIATSGYCLPSTNVRRSGIFASSGTPGACDGVLDVDWNVFGAALAQDDPALAEPGTTVHGQFVWFEPFGSRALTWSDAVAFQLCP